MPKGIPTNKTEPTDRTAVKRLTITLNPADYDALCVLAQEQYRTPDLQASYLIMRVLADAGCSPSIDERKTQLIGRVNELRGAAKVANGAQE
jgi:hypothetical protein